VGLSSSSDPPREDGYCVEQRARAAVTKSEVMCPASYHRRPSPESLLLYVISALASVILEDASRPNLFSEMNICWTGGRIVRCLPPRGRAH